MYTVESRFAAPDECDAIVELFDGLRDHPDARHPTDLRLEVPANVVSWHPQLDSVRLRVIDHLQEHHNASLRPEFTLLAEMSPGATIDSHADNEVCAAGGWVPNHTPYRASTALVYLTEFTGGEIAHKHVGTTLAPPKGSLVSFDCEGHYEHRVQVVQSGRRLALAVWAAYPPVPIEPWQ